MIAKFRNSGQACTAPNRIYLLERSISDRFMERFVASRGGIEVAATRPGPKRNSAR